MKTKTTELTGAQLDYWVARAEGIPAEQLTIRQVPRTDWLICVRKRAEHDASRVLPYSTDWAQGGPLIEKYPMRFMALGGGYEATMTAPGPTCFARAEGATPLQAICRTVVRAAFGDEVEEVAVCE